MVGRLTTHLRSHAIAYVALFVALGGTSYAAIKLPANSVGTPQLRANAVTGAKVKDGSLSSRDLAAGSLQRGPRGPEGPKGDSGTGAGAPAPAQTARGNFDVRGVSENGVAGDQAAGAISFGFQLASPPAVHIVGSPVPECPGNAAAPSAAPGHLCIYVGTQANIASIDTADGIPGEIKASRVGAGIFVVNAAAAPDSLFYASGTWAVTAP